MYNMIKPESRKAFRPLMKSRRLWRPAQITESELVRGVFVSRTRVTPVSWAQVLGMLDHPLWHSAAALHQPPDRQSAPNPHCENGKRESS